MTPSRFWLSYRRARGEEAVWVFAYGVFAKKDLDRQLDALDPEVVDVRVHEWRDGAWVAR